MDKGPRDQNFVNTNSVDASSLDGSSGFPADFAWGVATSSHQVEGGNLNNQWTAWEKGGRIKSKDCVGQACDWWQNAEQALRGMEPH
jgi:beta-glucosidase/6-phospho-beta-glucosidase/beta-galactosidase